MLLLIKKCYFWKLRHATQKTHLIKIGTYLDNLHIFKIYAIYKRFQILLPILYLVVQRCEYLANIAFVSRDFGLKNRLLPNVVFTPTWWIILMFYVNNMAKLMKRASYNFRRFLVRNNWYGSKSIGSTLLRKVNCLLDIWRGIS